MVKLGEHRTEETRKKIALANHGKHNSLATEFKVGHEVSLETRKKISKIMKGKPKSLEQREKISKSVSKALIGRDTPWAQGSNSHFWRGGITQINIKVRKSAKYRIWRSKVFERDLYICQKCGKSGVYLVAHHIKSFANYPDLRFEINNGLTLCKKCHDKLRDE